MVHKAVRMYQSGRNSCVTYGLSSIKVIIEDLYLSTYNDSDTSHPTFLFALDLIYVPVSVVRILAETNGHWNVSINISSKPDKYVL